MAPFPSPLVPVRSRTKPMVPATSLRVKCGDTPLSRMVPQYPVVQGSLHSRSDFRVVVKSPVPFESPVKGGGGLQNEPECSVIFSVRGLYTCLLWCTLLGCTSYNMASSSFKRMGLTPNSGVITKYSTPQDQLEFRGRTVQNQGVLRRASAATEKNAAPQAPPPKKGRRRRRRGRNKMKQTRRGRRGSA